MTNQTVSLAENITANATEKRNKHSEVIALLKLQT